MTQKSRSDVELRFKSGTGIVRLKLRWTRQVARLKMTRFLIGNYTLHVVFSSDSFKRFLSPTLTLAERYIAALFLTLISVAAELRQHNDETTYKPLLTKWNEVLTINFISRSDVEATALRLRIGRCCRRLTFSFFTGFRRSRFGPATNAVFVRPLASANVLKQVF